MNSQVKGLRLIMTIVDRGKGKKITKFLEKLGCHNQQIFLGYGTAPDEMLQYLGLATIEKDVIISIVDEALAPFILSEIGEKMHFALPGNGIACSIPIQSVASKTTLEAILGLTSTERSN